MIRIRSRDCGNVEKPKKLKNEHNIWHFNYSYPIGGVKDNFFIHFALWKNKKVFI